MEIPPRWERQATDEHVNVYIMSGSAVEKNKAGKWVSGGRGYDSKWGSGEGLAEEDTGAETSGRRRRNHAGAG